MQLQDLNFIHELSMKINSVLEMDKLLPIILDSFVKAGNIESGSIMIYDEKTGGYKVGASVGLSREDVSRLESGYEEELADLTVRVGEPIRILSSFTDKKIKTYAKNVCGKFCKNSLMCIPMIFREKILGVVNLRSKKDGSVFNESDETVLSILANSAAIAINNAKQYELVIIDETTGMFLNKYFLHRLNEELERARRHFRYISLITGEIDNYKNTPGNDLYSFGEKAMIHVSNIIKMGVRAADISARISQKRFAIILTETDGPSSLLMAERIRQMVEKTPFSEGIVSDSITVSMGVATSTPKRYLKANEMVAFARKALERAINQGRNRSLLSYE